MFSERPSTSFSRAHRERDRPLRAARSRQEWASAASRIFRRVQVIEHLRAFDHPVAVIRPQAVADGSQRDGEKGRYKSQGFVQMVGDQIFGKSAERKSYEKGNDRGRNGKKGR
jgi:hypothetical protein